MKKGIHPDYHKVLFVDTSTGKEWVSRSTITSDKTKEVGGEEPADRFAGAGVRFPMLFRYRLAYLLETTTWFNRLISSQ